MSRSRLINTYLRFQKDANIVDTPWDCDILSIQHEQIRNYIEDYGDELENFVVSDELRNAKYAPKLLRDLLQEDFEYLVKWNPELAYLRDKVFIEECDVIVPSVSVVCSGEEDGEYLVLFNSSIVDLIHYFYASIEIFFEKNFLLPVYEEIVSGKDYSDLNLMWILTTKIFNLYHKAERGAQSDFVYLHDPFNYCESVIAARRFLLAHELAHIHLRHHSPTARMLGAGIGLSYNEYSHIQEYEADLWGIFFLFNGINNISDLSQFCNLENHLTGILQVFLLLDFVEGFHRWYQELPDHPKAFCREIESYFNIMDALKKRYDSNELLGVFFHIAAIENQIIKRLPYNIVMKRHGVAGAALFHPSHRKAGEVMVDEAPFLEPKMKDIVKFLIEYQPYDQSKYASADDLEEQETIHWNDPQITVKIVGRSTQKGFAGVPTRELTEMIVEMAANIGAGIIANFIYERLKEKTVELWINSRPVKVNKTSIEAAISDEKQAAISDGKQAAPRQETEEREELQGDA